MAAPFVRITEKGLDDLLRQVEALPEAIVDVGRQWFDEVYEHAVERAYHNAPIWKHRLRPQIEALPVKRTADGLQGGLISTAVSKSGEDYAYLMHEFQFAFRFPPEVTPNGFRYSLGPKTIKMPRTEEGGPGGKYLDRVVWFHFPKYEEMLNRLLVAAFSKTKRRT